MKRQRHQLDHMQTICTMLQTDSGLFLKLEENWRCRLTQVDRYNNRKTSKTVVVVVVCICTQSTTTNISAL